MNRDDLLDKLQRHGNAERAIRDRRYHRSTRTHWGVPAGQVDEVVRLLPKELKEEELLALACSLWETDLFDPMMAAGKILALRQVRPSMELWKAIVHFMSGVDGWALEDQLAHAAWKCSLTCGDTLDDLEAWTRESSLWMRRAALVYTLPFAKRGCDPERMLQWAASYAGAPHWFIQKAIGWWLRVLGTHSPERVIRFLTTHWSELKGVAKREATRKLSEEWRQKV